MIIRLEDLEEIRSIIGFNCEIGVRPDPDGIAIRAWMKVKSGELFTCEVILTLKEMLNVKNIQPFLKSHAIKLHHKFKQHLVKIGDIKL